ncbi:hypothetical protein L1987_08230 [Smallanthus sonchifolius]|uniref:Uncharacterized protein n=1 Tax=Smallanthus sonchifolius TaxID=185202 RepID=A0ACB9JKM3_9ASTR|nr:hypothetical protein L1987_08230 [Smallanthus sonchifolius]
MNSFVSKWASTESIQDSNLAAPNENQKCFMILVPLVFWKTMKKMMDKLLVKIFRSHPCILDIICRFSITQLGGLSSKMMKRSKIMPEPSLNDDRLLDRGNVTIHRCNSTNSFPKLRFRDHIWTYTQRYLAAEAIEDAVSENGTLEDEGNKDEMHLVRLLVSCAEAVACRDKTHASKLLAELRGDALVFLSSFQRVASCFMQGLTDRLTMIQPLGAVGLVAPTRNLNTIALDKREEALRLVYETCLHIKFGHFIANTTILEVFEEEKYVHIVDLTMTLGLQQGHQWRGLIKSLSQTHTPRHLRITAIAVGPYVNQFVTIGNELKVYALEKGIDFEFSIVESSLETLKLEDIKTYKNEVLAVNRPNRVERHERVDQWRRRMSRAGFHGALIKTTNQTKQWLEKLGACEGYTIAEEKGCLVLGWKSKPIVAVSCWKC